ncbi:IclR family transcriptional regulator [Lutispora sp.]|uniref:IclR family transcriptional regulator n=1 Tax=Lutispora sp. TaxID=2828727 RepID=UPI0035693CEE
MAQNNNSVQSLDRAIMLLEELAMHQDGCGITRLSSLTGLHKSTVHRILNTLMAKGYIEKNPETEKYSLGMRFLYLSSAILDQMDIRKVAKPLLEKLCSNTGEVVHLSILDNGEAVYIDKVENPHKSIRMYSQIGKRVPLHCTGAGKILIAWLPDKDVEAILRKNGMEPFTSKTITDIETMKEHLKSIRKMGYAFDEMEHEEGIRCVAAPIYDINGKVVASVSVSGPVLHVTKERMPELTEEVIKTAKEISYHLGYRKKTSL